MRTLLGRVAAPPDCESTSGEFYFWVCDGCGVERTQIVATSSTIGGADIRFIGIVLEVYRRSRAGDVGEEADRFDGGRGGPPPFDSAGITYAKVAVLRTAPVAHAPPTEESEVYLASAEEACQGYGGDRTEHPLDVGLLRNGGTHYAGKATLDLDYLLGENGGHLNVNGIAGLGSKSSLLLHTLWMLMREARRQEAARPSGIRLQVAPIVFNVKNFDLFHIDKWNRKYLEKRDEYESEWREFGVCDQGPFQNTTFLAPQIKDQSQAEDVGRNDGAVKPYSWSLADVIEQRLFKFLFADDAIHDPNFGGLVDEVEEHLTREVGGRNVLRDNVPQTFDELLDQFKAFAEQNCRDYTAQTRGKVYRHLKFIVRGGDGVLRRHDAKGHPIRIPNAATPGPMVIDLFAIRMTPQLQRFVVAAVLHQLVVLRSKNVNDGLRFVVMLDELNRFAPRDSSDPITAMIETVAAEMRSQGVILFGAQQQASLVKPRVIANCAVKAIGRSDAVELRMDVWKSLDRSAIATAAQLQADEKLLLQPNFREPMLAKIPFPPFALKREHAADVEQPAANSTRKLEADF